MRTSKSLNFFFCLIFLIVAGFFLGSCSPGEPSSQDDKLKIVSTIFPSYDWVREIVGEDNPDIEQVLLIDNGLDMHSYQPSIADMAEISSCDILITVGGISETWVSDALETSGNDNMVVIDLVDLLGNGAKQEETKEGMTHTHDDEEDEASRVDQRDDEGERGDHEHDGVIDEHVWLSLRNAEIFCNALAQAIADLDPEQADMYLSNAEAYINELQALDREYETLVENASCKTIVVADRFPFRYLVDDYGLDYYAAFPGCEAEAEASFETLLFLSKKIDELGLSTIVVTESSDSRISRTVAENTSEGTKNVVVMDSMQSVTKADISAGISYLSVTEENLTALEQALS